MLDVPNHHTLTHTEGKYLALGGEEERRRKRRKIFGEVKYFSGGEEKRKGKKRKILAEGKYLARGGEENRKRRKIFFWDHFPKHHPQPESEQSSLRNGSQSVCH